MATPVCHLIRQVNKGQPLPSPSKSRRHEIPAVLFGISHSLAATLILSVDTGNFLDGQGQSREQSCSVRPSEPTSTRASGAHGALCLIMFWLISALLLHLKIVAASRRTLCTTVLVRPYKPLAFFVRRIAALSRDTLLHPSRALAISERLMDNAGDSWTLHDMCLTAAGLSSCSARILQPRAAKISACRVGASRIRHSFFVTQRPLLG